jgi:hypothetical protein
MTQPNPPTDWKARATAVAAADGDEWDRLSAAYDEDWKAAYRAAFIRSALARPGWTEELAKEWLDAGDLPNEALPYHDGNDIDPADAALRDVIECEIEAANA